LLVLNTLSALLFMVLVNRPVYDDVYNLADVHRYRTEGVTADTIGRHVNPTGPTGFLWMAAAARFLDGEELRAARGAVLASWLLLGAAVLLGARYVRFPELWYAGLIVTLAFPHSVSASALVLTEGPALLFATLGALAWVEWMSRPVLSARSVALGMAAGLSVGLAVTCRQYYLALLPAGTLLAFDQWRRRNSRKTPVWAASMTFSLALAVVPVLLLLLVWKGLSSPGMVSGKSYGTWQSALGVSFLRPGVAVFYTLLYFVPFTFPAMLRLRPAQSWPALVAALLGGISAAFFGLHFLQPGPFASMVHALGRAPAAGSVFLCVVAAVTIYNAVALGVLLFEQRAIFFACPPAAFALLAVLFFVGEQAGVRGNIPFYDRYILQIAPFMGIVAFALLSRLTFPRLLALGSLSVVSHAMLWRYVFRG
jgi:hypothetical protein